MTDICKCGHGKNTTHQGGSGGCIGYDTIRVYPSGRAAKRNVKCRCKGFEAAA